MIKLLRCYKGEILLACGILLLYFILRLINLTILPIFADEAIYIRWSQVMRAEATLRFLPLSDGKQPLFMWLTIPFLKIFSDSLFAGRFLSLWLVRSFRLDLSLISGLVLGGALITKSPAIFFALLLPSGLLLGEKLKKKILPLLGFC